MGAILYGIDVPPYGGDTMFANQYLAYDALSPAMKKMLEGLRGVTATSPRQDRSPARTRGDRPSIATMPPGRRPATLTRSCGPIARPVGAACSSMPPTRSASMA